jgi:ribose transport system substrate-binding protein
MKIKQIFILLLSTLFLFVTACGNTTDNKAAGSNVDTSASSSSNSPKTDKKIKIGVSMWNNADPLGKEVATMLEAAAKALDVELIITVDGFNPDKQVTNIQNMIAGGADAVMICNSSDAIIPKLIKAAEDGKSALGLYFRSINDPKVKEMADKSNYFVGVTHEDEKNVGYQLGKILAEKGSKNVALINWNHGDTVAEARYAGYKQAFTENNVKLLGEQWEISTGDKAAAAAENFISAFPELDGMVVVGAGGEPLTGAINVIKNHNKTGKINVVSSDFGPTLKESLKNQEISAMSGGHWVDPFFEFLLLYNHVTGHSLTKEKAEIIVNPLFISSPEMADDYSKWLKGSILPYTDEEIKNLTVKHNPQMNYQMLLDAAKNYSIDDVKKRHNGLIQ